ncbi:holo-ACP synthase [Aliiglaciecola lipolytica]|uniref:Holo-[acyl-carrier-protein] synthase n=1 Tax=Aliiglaciecola lipolytica E3 TaxID=1127673 RepID=K6YG36_9ALTE|nr:holo-ACP synthase [Aliiglaciecola lipolytica]GAC15603.1 holo-[acyl-carrier protein] synthase [Aliiglaciecola lipolytica E3]
MAVLGLGTDIVEIARLAKQIEKSDRLPLRILTPMEMQVYREHNFPIRYLAKRFAAKEAAVKALGTGIGNGVGWQHIELSNGDLGQPIIHFSGQFAQLCEQKGINNALVSISDEQHYAMATVILEQINKHG